MPSRTTSSGLAYSRSYVGSPSVPRNLGPKPTSYLGQWAKNQLRRNLSGEKKRGAIKGPIRIPLHSLLFLFNVLALPSISSKSLKFRPVLFSTPTRFRHKLFLHL